MKLEKAIKTLGREMINELEALSHEELQHRVVAANEAMRQADDELEMNEKYQETKENLKALTSGRSEVNKRQKAIICVALHALNSESK